MENMEKGKLNSEMIWKIWKISVSHNYIHRDLLLLIRRRRHSPSEMIWKIQKKIVKRYEKYGREVG
jgi:hypothetical protein